MRSEKNKAIYVGEGSTELGLISADEYNMFCQIEASKRARMIRTIIKDVCAGLLVFLAIAIIVFATHI